ncbi:hypothetical protein CEW89_05265 [Celeribacter ethanolicus]|uniref:Uncharacterized protein n=1 Tax=Celeribacter ethanolicus TaxID=1758178 RepID=A0A291GAF8_9RHOB|nr:hypothetical protein [Celeribacter ethanolicus]ATG47032.1 hypothetical protein CEW89_05265 [Celeribacter ethanolicus]
MQISSAYHFPAPQGTTQGSPQGSQSQNRTAVPDAEARGSSVSDGPASQDSPQNPAKSTTDTGKSTAVQSARDIFARYDLTAISANEIDRLTADLKAARFDDLGFVMGLERQGASYRADMEHSGSVYGIGGAEAFDPDAPMDLIAQTRSDLALARRYGQDTERLSTHLFKLEEAQMTRPVATATVSPPQLAETLVLFQAQRLWIE